MLEHLLGICPGVVLLLLEIVLIWDNLAKLAGLALNWTSPVWASWILKIVGMGDQAWLQIHQITMHTAQNDSGPGWDWHSFCIECRLECCMSGTLAQNQGKCKAGKLSALERTPSSTHTSSLLMYQLPFHLVVILCVCKHGCASVHVQKHGDWVWSPATRYKLGIL